MINRLTCFKNPDLILTNCPRSFQNSCVIETGLSDFHKLVVTVIEITYKKSQPKIIIYHNYRYSIMKVLEKNCCKLKPMEITAIKVLKTLLLHATIS